MGLAPARNKIQIAFNALESLLSLKRSMQHELVFKTLESDRKPMCRSQLLGHRYEDGWTPVKNLTFSADF
jgi:hypothetical protein